MQEGAARSWAEGKWGKSLSRICVRREWVKHNNNNFIKGEVGFLSSMKELDSPLHNKQRLNKHKTVHSSHIPQRLVTTWQTATLKTGREKWVH